MTIPHAGTALLPAARPSSREGAASSSEGDGARRQLAWQREMERAQLANWFRQPPPQDANRDASGTRAFSGHPDRFHGNGGPNPARENAAALPASARLTATGPLQLSPPPSPTAYTAKAMASSLPPRAAAHAATHEAAPTTESSSRSEPPWPAPSTTGRRTKSLENAASNQASHEQLMDDVAGIRAKAATFNGQDGQALVRVHEESAPSGQTMWIAMPANDPALAALLPQLVLDLHRAQALQGRHLHQVVCNGQLVWRDGEFTRRGGTHRDTFPITSQKEI